jgi:hypothetical protein
VSRPNASRPNASRPNASRPNASRPNASRPNFGQKLHSRWLEGAGDESRPYQEDIPTRPGALCSFFGRTRDDGPTEPLAGPPLTLTEKTPAAETEFPRP